MVGKKNNTPPPYEAHNNLQQSPYYADRDYLSMPRSPSETLEPSRANHPPDLERKHEQKQPSRLVSVLSTSFSVGFIGLLLAVAAILVVVHGFNQKGPSTFSTVVTIPSGDSLDQIANRLKEKNVIDNLLFFKVAARYFQVHNKLKAGEYDIPSGASLHQVVKRLSEGKSILHAVNFPEGMTSLQIVERLRAKTGLTGTIDKIPAEGSLLPDTYKFTRGTSRHDIIERMKLAQVRLLDGLWKRRSKDLPYKSAYEAVILASIVEKETGRASERPIISAVFLNRLKKKMRLQSDPTIIYGLVGGKGKLGRGIRRSEIAQKTPYNTYQINGLPPTPIANPGRAALDAVFHPETSDALFFVADGTGGHAFAKSLRDHNNNVVKWRAIERKRRAEQEAAAKLAETDTNEEETAQEPLESDVRKAKQREIKASSSTP